MNQANIWTALVETLKSPAFKGDTGPLAGPNLRVLFVQKRPLSSIAITKIAFTLLVSFSAFWWFTRRETTKNSMAALGEGFCCSQRLQFNSMANRLG